MMTALRDLWWLLTGKRMPGTKNDPRLTWLHEQTYQARRAAVEAEQETTAEHARRNVLEDIYRGGRRP